MFRDHTKIHVAAGRGGNGCTSFRREKHVPRGGPDGGDGGPGGDVWLVADPQLRDLSPFARKIHHKARPGRHGEGARKNGAAGESSEVSVPLGTQVFRDGDLIADLTRRGQRVLVAAGGPGGRGNARFVTSTRQAPRFSEFGEEGEEGWIELSLRLMSDVGLAGLPNAGKSSLLRRISNAAPKVADYPFTTVEPLLGVVEVPGIEEPFTVTDVPGLLEGASEGVGMGTEFLAHLERCHLLLHLVDASGYFGDDPRDNFEAILHELESGASSLAAKPQLVVLNKIDILGAVESASLAQYFVERVRALQLAGHPAFAWSITDGPEPPESMVWPISAVTGEGLPALLTRVGSVVAGLRARLEEEGLAGVSPLGERRVRPTVGRPADSSEEEAAGHVVYRPGSDASDHFTVRREDGRFVVEGVWLGRLVRRFDLENDQAVRYLGERLERLGLSDALRQEGACPGDEVEIEGFVFEFQ
jgi:GTP-binding protein